MEIAQISISESKKLTVEARGVEAMATALIVNSFDSYIAAGILRDKWMARANQAEVFMRPRIREADKHHKNMVADLKSLRDPFANGAKTAKRKMIVYDQEQQAIARKKQFELERQEREQAENEVLELAELAEAAGEKELAEELVSKPVEVASIVVEKEVPKVKGFSYRSVWSCEVVDFKALVMAVVEGKAPWEAIQPNEKFLGEQASSLKFALMWPGIKVKERKV